VPGSSAPALLDRLAELPFARELVDALANAGGVYLVGGAVRDLLRGEAPSDLDLVIDRDVARLARELSASGDASVRLHDRFGTATIALPHGRFDLARARSERYAHPGALPDVEPASIDEDLRRRDFTVNALAVALGGPRRGELVAVPRALDDLTAGILRVLHDASFRDDPTRLLRMARYAGRLGFSPDERTARLAREAIDAGTLETVSGARLGAELRLAAAEAEPHAALKELDRLGIGARLIPGFAAPDADALAQALALLPADGDRAALALAAAARRADPAELAGALDALAFSVRPRDAILAAVGRAPALAAELAAARRPSQIAEAVAGAPAEAVALAGALGDTAAAAAARRWLSELRHVGLEIDGNDLLAAGLTPGPALGAGLRAALGARLDGRAPSRAEQLAEALRAARGA
jgi:tRNA nucleotidyltransferase (CCA-adding enzyme)